MAARAARSSAQDSHRQYGASLAAASRSDQRDRQQSETLRQTNLHKGMQVRDDVARKRRRRSG